MKPEEYAALYRDFAVYCREFGGTKPFLVASGPSGNDVRWSRGFMDGLRGSQPQGLSMHYYTGGRDRATEFTAEHANDQLSIYSRVEQAITQQRSLLNSYRDGEKIGLILDEWGVWDRIPAENEKRYGKLWQQSTMRSAVAAGLGLNIFNRLADKLYMCNIAQSSLCSGRCAAIVSSTCRLAAVIPGDCARLWQHMKRKWTQGEKIAVWGVGVAAIAAFAIWGVVRESRHATPTAPPSEMAVSQSGRVVGVFAASIEELRARNHVALIPVSESEKTLAEIPAGSYAFVFAPYLAHSAPDALQMYTHNDPAYFEIHKLEGSQTELVGYVGAETQERLRKGLGKGEKLTLYSSSWQKAPNLAAISLRSVKCAQSRDIAVRSKRGTIVLFALDCKAI